jgi:hypothetical protein
MCLHQDKYDVQLNFSSHLIIRMSSRFYFREFIRAIDGFGYDMGPVFTAVGAAFTKAIDGTVSHIFVLTIALNSRLIIFMSIALFINIILLHEHCSNDKFSLHFVEDNRVPEWPTDCSSLGN